MSATAASTTIRPIGMPRLGIGTGLTSRHVRAVVAKSTCLLGVNDGSEAPRSHGTK
jgi:hypothetical protein